MTQETVYSYGYEVDPAAEAELKRWAFSQPEPEQAEFAPIPRASDSSEPDLYDPAEARYAAMEREACPDPYEASIERYRGLPEGW